MRENLPQFWTTPFSEASTHAKQKHWLIDEQDAGSGGWNLKVLF
jgi:hypothetical protein